MQNQQVLINSLSSIKVMDDNMTSLLSLFYHQKRSHKNIYLSRAWHFGQISGFNSNPPKYEYSAEMGISLHRGQR